MFDKMENLKIISSFHRSNRLFVKISNRKTHSFFIRAHGAMLYDFNGEHITVKEGEMLFVPKGASYTAKALYDGTSYTAIHFDADFTEQPKPACYSLENFYEREYIINCFSDLWNFGDTSEKYRCVSLFYSLLSYISTIKNTIKQENSSLKIIEPAIAYLKEHIYDSTLKTDKLHRMCGISDTYFRKIFTLRFGTTPQSYITAKRISHANSIISSGDFDTIAEVALSVGFKDSLYFSKVFKKIYGISPSQTNNF